MAQQKNPTFIKWIFPGINLEGLLQQPSGIWLWVPTVEDHLPRNSNDFKEFYYLLTHRPDSFCKDYSGNVEKETKWSVLPSDLYLKLDALYDAASEMYGAVDQEFLTFKDKAVSTLDNQAERTVIAWLPTIEYNEATIRMVSFETFFVGVFLDMQKYAHALCRIIYDAKYLTKNGRQLIRLYTIFIEILCHMYKCTTYATFKDVVIISHSDVPIDYINLSKEACFFRDFITVNSIKKYSTELPKFFLFYIKNFWYIPYKFAPLYLIPPNIKVPIAIMNKYKITEDVAPPRPDVPQEDTIIYYKTSTRPSYHTPCAFMMGIKGMPQCFPKPDNYMKILNLKWGLEDALKTLETLRPSFVLDFGLDPRRGLHSAGTYSWLPHLEQPEWGHGKLDRQFKYTLDFNPHMLHIHRLFMFCAACFDICVKSPFTYPSLSHRWKEVLAFLLEQCNYILCRIVQILFEYDIPHYVDINPSYIPLQTALEEDWAQVRKRDAIFARFYMDCLKYAIESLNIMSLYPVAFPKKNRPTYLNVHATDPPIEVMNTEEFKLADRAPANEDGARRDLPWHLDSIEETNRIESEKQIFTDIPSNLISKERDRLMFLGEPQHKASEQQRKIFQYFLNECPPEYLKPGIQTSYKVQTERPTAGKTHLDIFVIFAHIRVYLTEINDSFYKYDSYVDQQFNGLDKLMKIRQLGMLWLPEFPNIENNFNHTLQFVEPVVFLQTMCKRVQQCAAGMYLVAFEQLWLPQNLRLQNWILHLNVLLKSILNDFKELFDAFKLPTIAEFRVEDIPDNFIVLPYEQRKYRNAAVLNAVKDVTEYVSVGIQQLAKNFWILDEAILPIYTMKNAMVLPKPVVLSYKINFNDIPPERKGNLAQNNEIFSVPFWNWARYDVSPESVPQIYGPQNVYEIMFNAYYGFKKISYGFSEDLYDIMTQLEVDKRSVDWHKREWMWIPAIRYKQNREIDVLPTVPTTDFHSVLYDLYEKLQYAVMVLEVVLKERIQYPKHSKRDFHSLTLHYYHLFLWVLGCLQDAIEMLDMECRSFAERSAFSERNLKDWYSIKMREWNIYKYCIKCSDFGLFAVKFLLRNPTTFPRYNLPSYLKSSDTSNHPSFLVRDILIYGDFTPIDPTKEKEEPPRQDDADDYITGSDSDSEEW